MPEVIVENDVRWTDVAMVVLTAALVIGAFLAAWQVNRQIRQGERQQGEQLRASLRPLVVIPHAEALATDPRIPKHQVFMAWVHNIGAGPALQVEILGWVRIPLHGWDEPAEREAEVESLKAEADIEAPELRGRFGGIPFGRQPSPGFLVPQVELAVEDYAAKLAVLIYVAIYKDVFENTFPSKPKAEWTLGHIEISAPGSWSS